MSLVVFNTKPNSGEYIKELTVTDKSISYPNGNYIEFEQRGDTLHISKIVVNRTMITDGKMVERVHLNIIADATVVKKLNRAKFGFWHEFKRVNTIAEINRTIFKRNMRNFAIGAIAAAAIGCAVKYLIEE